MASLASSENEGIAQGPVYDTRDYDRGMAVMQFGLQTWQESEREADRKADIGSSTAAPKAKRSSQIVHSGLGKQPTHLVRKPALVDVPVGKGRVVLFSWNPLHRHQNHHDFSFLTNALLFHNDFPEVPTEQEMRRRDNAAALTPASTSPL